LCEADFGVAAYSGASRAPPRRRRPFGKKASIFFRRRLPPCVGFIELLIGYIGIALLQAASVHPVDLSAVKRVDVPLIIRPPSGTAAEHAHRLLLNFPLARPCFGPLAYHRLADLAAALGHDRKTVALDERDRVVRFRHAAVVRAIGYDAHDGEARYKHRAAVGLDRDGGVSRQ